MNLLKNQDALRPSHYMKQAIALATSATLEDEVPVGAIIVDITNNTVIAQQHNKSITQHNPTSHAEMLCIDEACKTLKSAYLTNCDIYVTLEPCPMCAHALSLAKIRRIYFGAYDEKSGGTEHGARIFHASSCHHTPEIYGGISESTCAELLKTFFRGKR